MKIVFPWNLFGVLPNPFIHYVWGKEEVTKKVLFFKTDIVKLNNADFRFPGTFSKVLGFGKIEIRNPNRRSPFVMTGIWTPSKYNESLCENNVIDEFVEADLEKNMELESFCVALPRVPREICTLIAIVDKWGDCDYYPKKNFTSDSYIKSEDKLYNSKDFNIISPFDGVVRYIGHANSSFSIKEQRWLLSNLNNDFSGKEKVSSFLALNCSCVLQPRKGHSLEFNAVQLAFREFLQKISSFIGTIERMSLKERKRRMKKLRLAQEQATDSEIENESNRKLAVFNECLEVMNTWKPIYVSSFTLASIQHDPLGEWQFSNGRLTLKI